MSLHIPIQLGPQTILYDIVFEGNRALSAETLLDIADFPLGAPFSNVELDAATARILTAYRDEGYAYATVRAEVDTSPDKTRARARFVANEHKPVIITGYEVRGAVRTSEALIISRLALCQDLDDCSDEEKYYKRGLVRDSEEQIATLGTFSSVSISLEDPEIPQERKRVIITVLEDRSQYIEPLIGFSTGEGVKGAIEYGHRNIGGQAVSLTVRLELAFLPDFLILDSDVRHNYQELTISERLERRNSVTLRFPNVGLGPKVDLVFDGVDVRDNHRDFGLTREALIPTLSHRFGYQSEEVLDRIVTDELRPKVLRRTVTTQTGASAEVNDVTLFGAEDLNAAIQQNQSLSRLLRVPEGRTIALAQRLSVTWDRRDNALAATMGTLVSAGVEHVSAFPLDESATIRSEFLKFTARGAFYVPLTKAGLSLAFSLAAGYNLQLREDSETYPDRLFYLGGVNTVRGFQLDEMVPHDVAQRILNGELVIDDVGVRGGDLFLNPRAELRVPLTEIFGLGVFLDTGNVWKDPGNIEQFVDILELRYAAGAGLRLTTPIGPVALDYGFKLVRQEWEDLGALHFSIGLF
jgi:outer membrane protein assembly factor BamA